MCGRLNYVKCTKQRDENVQQKKFNCSLYTLSEKRREEKKFCRSQRMPALTKLKCSKTAVWTKHRIIKQTVWKVLEGMGSRNPTHTFKKSVCVGQINIINKWGFFLKPVFQSVAEQSCKLMPANVWTELAGGGKRRQREGEKKEEWGKEGKENTQNNNPKWRGRRGGSGCGFSWK